MRGIPRALLLIASMATSAGIAAAVAGSAAALGSAVETLATAKGKSFDDGSGTCVDGNGACSIPPAVAGYAEGSCGSGRLDSMNLRHATFALVTLRFLYPAPSASVETLPTARRGPAGRPRRPPNCTRNILQRRHRPQWISTVEYNRATGDVLIADPKANQLLRFNAGTGRMGVVRLPADVRPASITRIKGGFVLNYREDAVILSTSRFKVSARRNLRMASRAATGLGTLYSNWVTWGEKFVGFGSVTKAPLNPAETQPDPLRSYQLGFVRGRVSASTGQFLDIELLRPTEENDLYLLGFPYFAANDKGLFLLDMTSTEAAIARVDNGKRGNAALRPVTAAIPKEFLKIPRLKGADEGPGRTRVRFQDIEHQSMVVGLFGQGSLLYVLARRYTSSGTEWLLHQIDPDQQKPLAVLELPTRANHLTVVADRSVWYFFERGEVRAWGDQDIKTVVQIPGKWIEDAAHSPLNVQKQGEVRCATRMASPAAAGIGPRRAISRFDRHQGR